MDCGDVMANQFAVISFMVLIFAAVSFRLVCCLSQQRKRRYETGGLWLVQELQSATDILQRGGKEKAVVTLENDLVTAVGGRWEWEVTWGLGLRGEKWGEEEEEGRSVSLW